MPDRRGARQNHHEADKCSGTGSQAPSSMESCHDCLTIQALHFDPLRIERYIAQVPEHSETKKQESQQIDFMSQSDTK